MIREDERRLAIGRGRAALRHAYGEEPQEGTVKQDRCETRASPEDPHGEEMQRPENREGDGQRQRAQGQTEPAHVGQRSADMVSAVARLPSAFP